MKVYVDGENYNGKFEVLISNNDYINNNFVDIVIGNKPEITIELSTLYDVVSGMYDGYIRGLERDKLMK